MQVRDLDHAATLVRDILENREVGPSLDMTLLNAAAAMVAAGIASSFGEGVDQARKTIRSGAAATTLESLVHASNQA